MSEPQRNRPERRLTGAAAGLALAAISCIAVDLVVATIAAEPVAAGPVTDVARFHQNNPDDPTASDTTAGDTTADDTTTTTATAADDREPGGGFVSPGIPDPDESAAARVEADEDGSGTSLTTVVLTAAIAALVAFAAGWFTARRRSTPDTPVAPTGATGPAGLATSPVGPPSTAPPPQATLPVNGSGAGDGRTGATHGASDDLLAEHRDALIRSLIEVGEMVSSEAVRARVADDLGRIGVRPVSVTVGDRFDPHRHRGVQAVAAPGPNADATVAACDRVGWADDTRVLRLPEVVVFRWEQAP